MICPLCSSPVDFISCVIIATNRHYKYKLGCNNPNCKNFVDKDFWHESKRTALNHWFFRIGRGRANKFRRIKGLRDADNNTLDIGFEEVIS